MSPREQGGADLPGRAFWSECQTKGPRSQHRDLLPRATGGQRVVATGTGTSTSQRLLEFGVLWLNYRSTNERDSNTLLGLGGN